MKSVAASVKAWRLALLAALASLAVSSAPAETIVSSQPFSIGYGATSKTGVSFTTTETGSANTPTTQGDFQFIPTVSGAFFSSAGATFINRVLGDGGSSSGVNAESASFGLSITGTYTGAVPNGYTPNIRLNISNMVVRGISYNAFGASSARWTETTSGASQQSANVSLVLAFDTATQLALASNFRTISWDPVDFYTDNSRSQTRTFVVTATTANGGNNVGLDGLEIFGTVDVVLVPEPASTLLLGCGLAALCVGRRRNRR